MEEDIRNALSGWLIRVATVKASDLARAGRYAEAEALLRDGGGSERLSLEVLDLLARIRAQQGRLDDAESCWTRALGDDPSNDSCLAGLERIRRMRKRPAWLPRSLTIAAGMVLLAVAVIAGIYAVQYALVDSRGSAPAEAGRATPRGTSITTSSRAGDGYVLTIDLPGSTVKRDGGDLVITFGSGLFPNGTRIGNDGKKAMGHLGRQLAPHSGRVSVVVTGHADNVPVRRGSPYRDNSSLGLARAVVAIEHLRKAGDLPSAMFSARDLGDLSTPYPNDTAANRLRNRTVVIRISSGGTRNPPSPVPDRDGRVE